MGTEPCPNCEKLEGHLNRERDIWHDLHNEKNGVVQYMKKKHDALIAKFRAAATKQGLMCYNTGIYGQIGLEPGKCTCGNCEMKKLLEETKDSGKGEG